MFLSCLRVPTPTLLVLEFTLQRSHFIFWALFSPFLNIVSASSPSYRTPAPLTLLPPSLPLTSPPPALSFSHPPLQPHRPPRQSLDTEACSSPFRAFAPAAPSTWNALPLRHPRNSLPHLFQVSPLRSHSQQGLPCPPIKNDKYLFLLFRMSICVRFDFFFFPSAGSPYLSG